MRASLLLAALTLAAPAFADDDLTPEKTAKIEREKNKALEAVDKKYGNRKSSEMSSDERREVIRERAAAENEVLEKNNVSPKAYVSYTAHMNKEDRAATKAADAKLEEKEKQAAAAKKDKETQGGPKEIQVQRGFNDNNPVVLEEKQGNGPTVEKGLPQDYADDQALAGQQTDSSSQAAPAKAGGKKSK
jgi:hypothetical protein